MLWKYLPRNPTLNLAGNRKGYVSAGDKLPRKTSDFVSEKQLVIELRTDHNQMLHTRFTGKCLS